MPAAATLPDYPDPPRHTQGGIASALRTGLDRWNAWPRDWRLRKDQAAERPDVAIRTRAARIVDALGKAVAVEDRDRFPK